MSAALQLAIVPSAEQWISAEEAMQITGWTDRWLRAKVACGAVISRESTQTGPNGRPVREYLLSSLPLSPSQAVQTHLTVVAPPAASFGPLFAGVSANLSERIVLPDSDSQAQAEQRLAILRPVLDYPDDPERFTALALPDGRRVTSVEKMIEYVAAGANVSSRTIKRWLAAYRASNFAALADRVRADKGQSRWFSRHHQAAILAAYLYLGDIDRLGLRTSEKPHRGQSVAFVYEQICEQADSLGIAKDELPSRETVRLFLSQQISPAMKALARDGQRQYRERMSPYIRRRYDDIYANQVWVGDQMWHDTEVANDIFDDMPLGAPVRLRLDAFEDFRSRKIVGATWTHHGSSRSIAATLRRGILQYGPPEMIYVDNGKDYKKVAKGAQRGFPVEDLHPEDIASIEQTGFLARIGCGVVHCIPRHPQSTRPTRPAPRPRGQKLPGSR
jgi:transposase InsO family protein